MLNQHLTEEILTNYIEGLLPQDQLAGVNSHLQTCALCSTEAASFAEIIDLMQTDSATDAPQDSLIWAKNLFRSKIAEPKKSVVQKILAALQMDLSQQPVFGERSSASPVKQMLYRADEIGITLKISGNDEKLSLRGQVLGEKFGRCNVVLRNESNCFSATADELSEFKLPEIPRGIYDLTISNHETDVLVEGIELS